MPNYSMYNGKVSQAERFFNQRNYNLIRLLSDLVMDIFISLAVAFVINKTKQLLLPKSWIANS